MSRHTAMKLKIIVSLLILGIQTIFSGQNLEIKPCQFISKAKDTLQAELGTFIGIEDQTKGRKDLIQLSFHLKVPIRIRKAP
tara:strand:+ start:805 stop:1050 length:246 start_codon:yes stop_codon:yes gene_type:complete